MGAANNFLNAPPEAGQRRMRMELWSEIFTRLKEFFDNLKNAIAKIPELKIDVRWQKVSVTVEMGKNGWVFKIKISHKKSGWSFHIGILIKKGKENLFLSFDDAQMLMQYKYPLSLPLCSAQEPGNDETEVWFVVDEPYNEEFFKAETTETRKKEIIAQILTGVVETLDNQ
jgi:hypothetical protein